MKNLSLITALATTLLASACSSSQQTANSKNYGDDVYTAGTNEPAKEEKAAANTTAQSNAKDYSNISQNGSTQEGQTSSSDSRFEYGGGTSGTDKDGNTYITNNYYNDDDYYDYAYTARIRRFYRPMYGYGYYDPFYTNSYWYDNNPYNYGVSIYLGYNWWAPSAWYSPYYCSFSFGYSPYNYWWSNPYNYYGYNYYGYGHGYYHGYNNGYWNGYYDGLYASNGYNPYYFNSYDPYSYNDYYYGPRRSAGSNHKRKDSSYGNRSIAQTYHNAVVNEPQQNLPVSSTFASTMNYASDPRPMNNSNVNGGVKNPRGNSEVNSSTNPRDSKNNTLNPDPRPMNNTGGDVKNPRGNSAADAYSTPKDVKNNTNADPRQIKNNDVKNNNGWFDDNPRGNTNSDPRPVKNNDVKNNTNDNPRSNDNTNYESTPRPKKDASDNYNFSAPNNNTYESAPRPRKNNDVKKDETPRNNYESTPRPRKQENYEKPKSFENSNPAPRQERNNSFERPRQSAPSTPAPQPKRENNSNNSNKRGR